MPIDPAQLARLTHRRWALPILAELARQRGAKFVTLVHGLGAHHLAIRQALDELIALGLVVRNPGYGHPLRPEYILTETGEAAAAICETINEHIVRRGWGDVAYRKWSLPTLLAVHRGSERFAAIRTSLGTATDRAVALALGSLCGAEVLTGRSLATDARAVLYGLKAPGREIALGLEELPALG